MKPFATLLFVLSFTATTSRAQSCPGVETLPFELSVLSSSKTIAESNSYLAILASDLSIEQKMICLATKGRRISFSSAGKADDPLSSVLDQDWDANLADWVNTFLSEVSYHEGGDFFSAILISAWNLNTEDWVEDSFLTFLIDEVARTFEVLLQEHDGVQFMNSLKQIIQEDEFGNQILLQQDIYENQDWSTIYHAQSMVENGLITQTETHAINDDTGIYGPVALQHFEYDELQRVINETVDFWNPDTEVYETIYRDLTVYSDNSTVVTTQFLLGPEQWLDFSQTTSNYDQGLLIDRTTMDLFSGTPESRSLYEYNDMQLQISAIDQLPDGVGGWMDDRGLFSTYDQDGDVLEELLQIAAATVLQNDSRSVYNYGETGTATEDEFSGAIAAFDLYPSPAKGRVNLSVTLDRPAALLVEVFDVLGRRVASLVDATVPAGVRQLTWDPGQQAAGVYLVRFNYDDASETRSIVLIK